MPQQALFHGGPAILLPAFPLARMLAAGTLNNGRRVTVQDHRSTLTTQQHHLRLVFDKLSRDFLDASTLVGGSSGAALFTAGDAEGGGGASPSGRRSSRTRASCSTSASTRARRGRTLGLTACVAWLSARAHQEVGGGGHTCFKTLDGGARGVSLRCIARHTVSRHRMQRVHKSQEGACLCDGVCQRELMHKQERVGWMLGVMRRNLLGSLSWILVFRGFCQ